MQMTYISDIRFDSWPEIGHGNGNICGFPKSSHQRKLYNGPVVSKHVAQLLVA